MVETKVIMIVALCALLGAAGQILFKMASGKITLQPLSWLNWHLFFGLVLYGVSTVLFIWALKHGPVSILYPIISLSYIFVALVASFFLGEVLSWQNWTGMLLIIGGVGLVAL